MESSRAYRGPPFLTNACDPRARADRLARGAVLPAVHPWLRGPLGRLWWLLEQLAVRAELRCLLELNGRAG